MRHEALVRRKRQLKGWAHLLPRRIRAHRHALSALFSPFVYSRKPAGNTGVCELRDDETVQSGSGVQGLLRTAQGDARLAEGGSGEARTASG